MNKLIKIQEKISIGLLGFLVCIILFFLTFKDIKFPIFTIFFVTLLIWFINELVLYVIKPTESYKPVLGQKNFNSYYLLKSLFVVFVFGFILLFILMIINVKLFWF